MVAVARKLSVDDYLFENDEPITEDKLRSADGFLGPKKKRAKKSTIPDSKWSIARREADRMMSAGDWTGAWPRHFVALWEMLHERVYGVAPAELTPDERLHASSAADRLLHKQFNGDCNALAAFIRWTWQREVAREKWRRENTQSGGRIGWRLQFGTKLLDDYRVNEHRRAFRKGT